eukprot:gnl/TRDRNA2_/TRDRNA2_84708_c0_seq1.p1 gnl/TRDRNA2_/TRDRNA2_84708_c0~~gnl/TRDRNA2_/TRDRNA2_84708_c0_seq1.p1  ORF type:complete len:572 (+),score=105.35 gnl/TRDRNA2_/TRDRNA2_84708_c0_seq1:251-1966(+)
MSSFSFMTAGLMCIFLLLLAGLANGVNVPGLMKKQGNRHFSESKANDDIMSSAQEKLAEADQGISDSELLAEAEPTPTIIPLRRESVPVRRQGKIVSYKTSYSGFVNVGYPEPQAFRVVFDTGSGHIILPSKACQSESCAVHATYDMSKSQTATPINVDGSVVKPGELCDQVTIGFGTGTVTGEFVREKVCLGQGKDGTDRGHCVEASMVAAIEMSTQPFKNFGFDGIMGLGLSSLALAPEFSFFDVLTKGGSISSPTFGVFLTEGDEGEESEIAIGGHNRDRIMEELTWSPVAMADLGYWQVEITAFRVNGVAMDFCNDGSCRGVVDTGTSHLGIPAPYDAQVSNDLTQPAGDLTDCRDVPGATIELELKGMKDRPGLNITLHPENYMRRLPLAEGVNVASAGVSMINLGLNVSRREPSTQDTPGSSDTEAKREPDVPHWCRPRLMPVKMAAPLGPHLFILGEPVLHRYYTVFNWKEESVGFSLAKNRWNIGGDERRKKARKNNLADTTDIFLMQITFTMSKEPSMNTGAGLSHQIGGMEVVGAMNELFTDISTAWAAGQPRAIATHTEL